MADLKKIGMATGTFSVALGIGFVMQNGDALANRFGGENINEPTPFSQIEAPVEVVQANLTGDFEATPRDETVVTEPEIPAVLPVLETPVPEAEFAVSQQEVPVTEGGAESPLQLASIDPEVTADLDYTSDISPEILTDVAVSEVDEIDCVPSMMAVAGDAATIELAVVAPCHIDTAFTVHHQGMMFSVTTGAEGTSKFVVPCTIGGCGCNCGL